MLLSNYIKNLRKIKGITQRELAKELNVSLSTIKKIETEQTEAPSVKLLEGLSKYLHKNPVAVFSDIMIPYDESLMNENEIHNVEFVKRIIATFCIDNFNLKNIFPCYDYLEMDFQNIFFAELCLKKSPSHTMVLSKVIGYIKKDFNINKQDDIWEVWDNIILSIVKFPKRINKLFIVFDADYKLERDLYKAFCEKKIHNMKTGIVMGLYDTNQCGFLTIHDFVEEYEN